MLAPPPDVTLTPGSELQATTRIRRATTAARAGRAPRIGFAVATILVAQLAAFWPVWHDAGRRLWVGIDEPWGLLALATAAAVVTHRVVTSPPTVVTARFILSAAAPVILYAVARHHLSPLAAGLLATAALGLTLCGLGGGAAFRASTLGLLVFSLPLSSALQFYLGYPMRAATAACTAAILRTAGLAVMPAGTILRFGDQQIWIDAPCSGVKMLWAGLFLALALCAVHRLGNARTIVAAALALVAVFAGNVLRSVGLFYFEARIVHAPAWAHAATGVVAFTLPAAAIAWLVGRLARLRVLPPLPHAPTPSFAKLARRVWERVGGVGVRAVFENRQANRTPLLIAHLVLCAVAATVPFVTTRPTIADVSDIPFPGWPAHFDGRPLLPSPMAEHERGFLDEFPGRVAKFTDGHRQIVLRWTPIATRKLHLSSDCFRGAGFEITPKSALASPSANAIEYSRFVATRGGESLAVSERIYDDAGHSWPDASSWYWSATTGSTRGPWWAVTIVETARGE